MPDTQHPWDIYGEWEAAVKRRLPDYCHNVWEDMDDTLKTHLYAVFAPMERDHEAMEALRGGKVVSVSKTVEYVAGGHREVWVSISEDMGYSESESDPAAAILAAREGKSTKRSEG